MHFHVDQMDKWPIVHQGNTFLLGQRADRLCLFAKCVIVVLFQDTSNCYESFDKENMGGLGDYKPAMGMIAIQFIYAVTTVSSRAAFLKGMSPRVFVVYRQAMATLAIAPVAYFSR